MKLTDLLFGAQYYRAPTPREDAWESDLSNMARVGMNVIKIWLCWRSNNPAEGVYDFSDVDKLMDTARDKGLKVIINLIFDTAPAWFFAKYPESVMITNGVGPIHPTATACRQMGGAPGPCYHHKAGIESRRALITEAARRYREHPALLYWDVWNEPEHTCAIKRAPTIENLTCYCDESIAEFRRWLEKKYENVAALNAKWGRNYQSFAEVEVPRLAQAFGDMIDWRLFMTETITREAQMRFDALRSVDSVHPAMLHTVTLPFFPLATCGSDDTALAEMCDLFGNSVGSEPLAAAITLSSAPGKPVINAEIHSQGGSTYARPKINTLEDMKRHLLVPLGLGIKGFVFWQYRAERLGLESPAWGLTDLAGNETETLRATMRINAALQQNKDVILNAPPPRCAVGIINSQKAQLFDFCVNQSAMAYAESVRGAYGMLRSQGYTPYFVSDQQMTREHIRQYRVLYDPFPYYKDRESALILKEWIEAGGVYIAEACFGGYSADENLHALAQPGFGFDSVFGAEEEFCTSVAHFRNAYDAAWEAGSGEGTVEMRDGDRYMNGMTFCQGIRTRDAKPLLTYADGRTAACANAYGSGTAIWIGSLPALAYQAKGKVENAAFIGELVRDYGHVSPALDARKPGVCASLLESDAGQLIVVDNSSATDSVHLSTEEGVLRGATLVDILTGDKYASGEELPVKAGQVDAYRVVR